LPKLERLSLYGSQVTDDCIESIAAMRSLKSVTLGNTAVTDAARKRLQDRRPDLPNISPSPQEGGGGLE
jgi:hypothetical protein